MVNFEQSLMASMNNTIGLPYWDWTKGTETDELIIPKLAEEEPWSSGSIKTDPYDQDSIGGRTRRFSLYIYVFFHCKNSK